MYGEFSSFPCYHLQHINSLRVSTIPANYIGRIAVFAQPGLKGKYLPPFALTDKTFCLFLGKLPYKLSKCRFDVLCMEKWFLFILCGSWLRVLHSTGLAHNATNSG